MTICHLARPCSFFVSSLRSSRLTWSGRRFQGRFADACALDEVGERVVEIRMALHGVAVPWEHRPLRGELGGNPGRSRTTTSKYSASGAYPLQVACPPATLPWTKTMRSTTSSYARDRV